MNAPRTIYLQVGAEYVGGFEEAPEHEITWCSDRVEDTDIEYVRKDVADAEIAQLRQRVAELEGSLDAARNVAALWHRRSAASQNSTTED